jgi:transcriptional regulator with XRE-family HTH domain
MEELGKRLRKLREDRKLSIRKLSEATGFSVSFLHRLETGKSSITVKNLIKLLNFYGVTLTEIFSETTPDKTIFRSSERRVIESPEEVTLELVAGEPEWRMESLLATFSAHAKYMDPVEHGGEEFAMVLRGEFNFFHGDKVHRLREGDCAYFKGEIPHSWENLADTESVLLMVFSPPVI